MSKVIFQPANISSKRKAFLEAEGYVVRDIRFAPAGYNPPEIVEPLSGEAKESKITKSTVKTKGK